MLSPLFSVAHRLTPPTAWNPWDGVEMDLTIIGEQGMTAFGLLLGAVWALAFGAMAFACVVALLKMRKAGKASNPQTKGEALKTVQWTGAATVGIAIVPVIFGILSNIGTAVSGA